MPASSDAGLPTWAAHLCAGAAAAGEDVSRNLELAAAFGARLPLPGAGDTWTRWAVLAAVAEINLTTARIFEAHTDALAILAEAGDDSASATTWGVFAAEASGVRLDATCDPAGSVTLTGTKPWCSLGGSLDAALVTARVGDERQLFRVDLHASGVRAEPAASWVARGLRTISSGPVHFDATPATPVGGPGWYLVRSGFAWGGLGVAACWYGGALGLRRTLLRAAASRSGELNALHVGTVDVALHAATVVLTDAAARVDAGLAGGDDGAVLALRVRSVVAAVVERVLAQTGRALGPSPLAFDAGHAARVADLELYVRQHHGERDLAALGTAVLTAEAGDRA